jgi:chromosomal replication initiator protein
MDSDLSLLWNKILDDIKKEVSLGTFLALFRQTHLLELRTDTAVIAAPSLMVTDLLQKRHLSLVQEIVEKHCNMPLTIHFVVKALPLSEKVKSESSPLFVPEEKDLPQNLDVKREIVVNGHLPRVRADYTFENFAVSGSNQLAFVSANSVAANLGKMYNPFFIYGPVGVGKTHLMHAIANDVYQRSPEKKIIYITSEEFTNEVVEAIRSNDTARMKKRFRSAYLLLIDDIQFIEGKERVQEEIFHTFNILIDNGSQICLSSDRPPHEIKRLEKRLSSRFAGGLTVDIGAPDFELKTAILLIKSKKFGHELPIDVAKFVATQAEDTRTLEGLLLRIITQATTKGQEINLALAEECLGVAQEERKERLHVEDVIKGVCSFYNIKPTLLKGPKRDASLVRARQITMYLLKNELGLTYVEIGNILGGRDHTTVMHGVDKIEHLSTRGTPVSEDIVGISKMLRG